MVNQASAPADVKFLSDGDVVMVGGYNYEARYQKYGEDCSDRSLDGETSQGMMHQRSQALEMFRGARSNIVKLSGGGDFMWGREFGSTNNVNVATSLAVDPNNDDLYIVGIWEKWNETQDHVMSPSVPANAADHAGITFTHDPSIKMAPSDHEPDSSTVTMCGKASNPWVCPQGWQVNQDTYLLHTDKHGNYKGHETYDVHLTKDGRPEIDISSDGSQLAISNTAYLQEHNAHTGVRHGASGWVMTVNTADLTPKWTTISEPVANSLSRWRDVQYAPNDNLYVGGQWYNQVKFGETAGGDEVLSQHAAAAIVDPVVAAVEIGPSPVDMGEGDALAVLEDGLGVEQTEPPDGLGGLGGSRGAEDQQQS